MALDLSRVLRKHILSIKPYSSARDEYKGELGVFLDANENPFGSPLSSNENYNRYPDPLQWKLKTEVAKLKGLAPEQLFFGNGSDEPIDLLMRACCEPGMDAVMQCPPTYGMYQVCADINNVPMLNVPLVPETYDIDAEAIISTANSKGVKIIYLCSPNNPTANLISEDKVLQVLQRTQALVVVDEAYIDFASRPSMSRYLKEYPNLVILQTFSKAWGLAGLRLGMALADEGLVAVLNKIKYPYNINLYTQRMAMEALTHRDRVEENRNVILQEREKLVQNLSREKNVIKVYPSDANFILVKTDDAKGIYDALIVRQIIVRDRSRVMLCEGCLRITVGTPTENEQLMSEWPRG